MELYVLKDTCIGSICAVSVLVFIRWWCWNHGDKPMERSVVPAPDGDGDDTIRDDSLEARHKVFLSHSGAQKDFVEQLCVDLERRDRYPFFDRRRSSLQIGKNFPKLIFEAIELCEVGVVVISPEFLTRSKWPMLELVAMTKNPKVVIIPVFLGISIEQVRDPKNQKRWLSIWRGWAQNDKRGIDIQLWLHAVKALSPLNALVYDGKSEVSFREKIVEAVCDHALPETRWEDSHVQGRSRLCQVVIDKIAQTLVSKEYGVRLVGLYGVGGIGKTTLCQTLCNVYFTKMHGRVFHAELGCGSELELLHGALRSLTNKSQDMVVGWNISQCQAGLKKEMQKQVVFLAIDNMSDNIESIEVAKFLLSVGFDKKSVVIVTARSLDVLKIKHLDIDGTNCFEMPELEEEEAKSLFLQHASCNILHEGRNEVDDKIVSSCIKRCHFQKLGDGHSYHYHPLALKVLGVQLGSDKYDPSRWASQLKEFDTFNPGRALEHPIFSILRKSFDTLLDSDQLLFLDIALIVPERYGYRGSVFEWLGMVHGVSVSQVMKVLEGLKRKSLLEDLGDGLGSRIGMHDLWREFAETETKVGGFGCRSWVYEVGGPNSFEEVAPSGGWQNVKRMCFIGKGVMNVKRINFDDFSNTTVLKLVSKGVELEPPMLDVKKLKHLKSLELVDGYMDKFEIYGLRSMENLRFLRLIGVHVSDIDDIEHLTNLQVLVVDDFQGRSLPDISKLVSLQEVQFRNCSQVTTVTGFSSRLNNLKILTLYKCDELESLGPGAEDLVALQELSVWQCEKLEFPLLQKLRNMQILDIFMCSRAVLTCNGPLVTLQELKVGGCRSVSSVPDLIYFPGLKRISLTSCDGLLELICGGLLDALEELCVRNCSSLKVVPSLGNFRRLKTLGLWKCDSLKELTCNGPLLALQELYVNVCRSVKFLPDLIYFPVLKRISLQKCDGLLELICGGPLDALKELYVWECSSLKVVPSLGNFQRLKRLGIGRCDSLVELMCNGPLLALQELKVDGCGSVNFVPDLIYFPGLKRISLGNCDGLLELICGGPLVALEELYVWDCLSLKVVPNLGNFQRLKTLDLKRCDSLVKLLCNGPLLALQELKIDGCRSVTSVPDLIYFPGLKRISLKNCDGLLELICGGPLDALEELYVWGCSSVKVVPSLGNFQRLKTLDLNSCDSLVGLMCHRPLLALQKLQLFGCPSVTSVPDLIYFPGLKKISLKICDGLLELICGGRLDALQKLYVWDCSSLKVVPSLSNFPGLKTFYLRRCYRLLELTWNGPLVALQHLVLLSCPSVNSVLDLIDFPGLKIFRLKNCDGILELICGGPLDALEELDVWNCSSVIVMPNLINFPGLKKLYLISCTSLKELTCSAPLVSLHELYLLDCVSLNVIPDLSNFPQSNVVMLSGCVSLTELACTGPLDALQQLDLGGCRSLKVEPDLSNFPRLDLESILYQRGGYE